MKKLENPTDENIYRKLQLHFDQMPIGFPATESGIELELLKYLFTPEQARAALLLSAVSEPIDRIKGRDTSGFGKKDLIEILDEMYENGLIRRHMDSKNRLVYAKLPLAIGIYELQVSRLTKELEELFHRYGEEAFGEAFMSRRTTQLRTVPVDIRLTSQRNVTNYDDARMLIQSAPPPFAVMDCICKKGQALLGNPCRQTKFEDTCLTIGSAAERVLREERGRELTREETLKLLDKAEASALVVQPQNTQNPNFICFCCRCCCHVLRLANHYPEPASYFTTNYFARVDPDLCIACGECSSRCQIDAIFTDEGQTVVNLGRCIGCGLCVTSCPSGAVSLELKDQIRIPPRNQEELYLKITKERFGVWGTAKLLGKKIMGWKI